MASTPGFSLQVTIYINPKDVERWFELFKPVFDHVIAEPECRFFELYQSFDDPGTISWVENWFVVFLSFATVTTSSGELDRY